MKLLFRADASELIGTGHVMRCLTLAGRWREQGQDGVFAVAVCTPALKQRIRGAGFDVEQIDSKRGEGDDARGTLAIAARISAAAVVVDGSAFNSGWHGVLREAGVRTLLINDDPAVGFFPAELVLNQNAYATRAAYAPVGAASRLLLGPHFSLIRPEFLCARANVAAIGPAVRTVLITMGGSDPHNLSAALINAIMDEPVAIRVVAGGSNPWTSSLEALARTPGRDIRLFVDVPDMAEHMAWADVAIAAAGSTALELACLGVPTLYVVTAANQGPVADSLTAEGIGMNLGSHAELRPAMIVQALRGLHDAGRRSAMRMRGRALVDGHGTDRVLFELRKMLLTIRPAGVEDRRPVWEWVNDAHVRAMSFTRDPIPWTDHMRWWARRVTTRELSFFIGEMGAERIGYVRFDCEEPSRATVSLALAPSARGNRLGAPLLDAGCEYALNTGLARCFDAYIRPENTASIRCFETAGFVRGGTVQVKGREALKLSRHERAEDGSDILRDGSSE